MVKILKTKKSQIFTLISISIILLFFVTYEVYGIFYSRNAVKTRVQTMDSFIFSLEQDFVRKLYISGFRIVFLAENQIAQSGNYIPNFSLFFREAIEDGTVNGEISEIMMGSTLSNITSSIKEKAEKMNLDIELDDIEISISQHDPWNLGISYYMKMNITDKSGLARWYKNETFTSLVGIEGFEDPVYLIGTSGKISRVIQKTPYQNYVSGGDYSNITSHIEKKYYANNSDAPSFINRLEGNFVSNPNGIESFVYIPEIAEHGLAVLGKSVIDHIYFSIENPSVSSVQNLPSWVKLDAEHKTAYQLV